MATAATAAASAATTNPWADGAPSSAIPQIRNYANPLNTGAHHVWLNPISTPVQTDSIFPSMTCLVCNERARCTNTDVSRDVEVCLDIHGHNSVDFCRGCCTMHHFGPMLGRQAECIHGPRCILGRARRPLGVLQPDQADADSSTLALPTLPPGVLQLCHLALPIGRNQVHFGTVNPTSKSPSARPINAASSISALPTLVTINGIVHRTPSADVSPPNPHHHPWWVLDKEPGMKLFIDEKTQRSSSEHDPDDCPPPRRPHSDEGCAYNAKPTLWQHIDNISTRCSRQVGHGWSTRSHTATGTSRLCPECQGAASSPTGTQTEKKDEPPRDNDDDDNQEDGKDHDHVDLVQTRAPVIKRGKIVNQYTCPSGCS